MSLTKAFLVSVAFIVCIGLLGHVSLMAFTGEHETSGQEQTALASLQDDLGPAAPVAEQDASAPSSASSYLVLPPEAFECMGPWAPLTLSLKTAFNARAG